MEDTAAPPPVKGSIAALPPTTIKLIGSAQVLSDPSSVVKELIDNALDARATSIVVEISSNTLDVIQVRDNGHGIAPEDRPMAARRYCTSKIRKFDDLKDVGGRWLGFRGEALASMAEMSGSLSIITRVEGEAVAMLLKMARNGEISGKERASHPMGTTVRLTDFFKSLPVRKQAALKHSSKYLAKVKKLMQVYALCRPKTRFSLRVLKAANEKSNWMYAPKPDANVEDAAFKVIGRECASQCEWTILESNGFEIQAFLPKPAADASKIGNVGHFISVDSRPVSAVRGVLKQFVVLFKDKITKSAPNLSGVRDPFIFMNIVCPPDSYDANIEPAKDDVLFENSDMVTGAVRQLLDAYYPECPKIDLEPSFDATDHDTLAQSSSQRRSEITIFEDESEAEESSPKRRRTWRTNMYGIDQEDLDLLVENTPDLDDENDDDDVAERRKASISNPWTIAKMNASIKAPAMISGAPLMTPLRERGGQQANSSSPVISPSGKRQIFAPLPTPDASSPGKVSASADDESLPAGIQYLPTPRSNVKPARSFSTDRSQDDEICFLEARQTPDEPRHDFRNASQLTLGTQLEGIPEIRTRPHRKLQTSSQSINKPFVPPVRNLQNDCFNNGSAPRSSQPSRRRKQGRRASATEPPDESARSQRHLVLDAANALFDPGDTTRNRDIRDFAVPKQPPQLTRTSADASPAKPLPQRRVRVNRMEDEDSSGMEEPRIRRGPELPPEESPEPEEHIVPTTSSFTPINPQPNIPGESTRPIATKRRRRTTDHLQRTKSAKLPLERVPPEFQIQNAYLVVETSVTFIAESFRKLDTTTNFVDWEKPTDHAYDAFSISPTPGMLKAWCARLEPCLRKTNASMEMVGDLYECVQSAFAAHDDDVVDENVPAIL